MIQPRRLGHRGTVVATGFAIDTALIGVAEARRRVLAWWTAGAVVREHGAWLVLTGLPPVRVQVAVAPGAPLVDQRGVLAAMPLDPDEVEALAAPGGIVLARGGMAEAIPAGSLRVIDVAAWAAWIDLSAFAVAHVEALGSPPVRAVLPGPPPADVRALFGIAAADPGAAPVVAGLVKARGPSGLDRPSWRRRLLAWFAARLGPRPPGRPSGGSAPASDSASDSASALALAPVPARPSLIDRLLGRLLGRLRSRIAEALWRSRLGAVLGRQHAAYLDRLFDLFDQGQLDEALRLAIPIDGQSGEAGSLSLAVPRPRQDLRLSFTKHRGGSSIPVADEALAAIRERYRAAVARLEQQGRIDEAAFVLADLLTDVPAAIALLERHERFALAARLAEGRGLAPGIVVRLWFLAGDRERAIDAARRHGAWADAVARLEQAGDARAAVLRMLWADHLADTGDFVQAVEVAWPVQSSRALIGAWIDRGIAAEGSAAARLLVKKLIVAPDAFPSVAPAIVAIFDDPELDAVRRRQALIEELVAAPASPELRTIARPAVRALVRDHGAAAEVADPALLARLLRFADDAALRADRPAIRTRPPASPAAERAPIALRWPAGDSGALPVHDAAVVPGGRLLVALGELGVRVIGRDGRAVAQIDQPATRLVVSDHGTRALAIAPRGQVQRIARLDLVDRRGAPWCDAECDGGAPTFDGDLWLVTRGREVLAVDTTAARWRAVWGIETELPAPRRTLRGIGVVSEPEAARALGRAWWGTGTDPAAVRCLVRREGAWFAIESFTAEACEHWYFEGFTLRSRRDGEPGSELIDAVLVAAWVTRRERVVITRDGMGGPDGKIALGDAPVIAFEIEAELAAVAQRRADGVTVTVGDLATCRLLAILDLEAASVVSLRLAAGVLTLGDDRGRIIVIHPRTGAVSRDLRVSA